MWTSSCKISYDITTLKLCLICHARAYKCIVEISQSETKISIMHLHHLMAPSSAKGWGYHLTDPHDKLGPAGENKATVYSL